MIKQRLLLQCEPFCQLSHGLYFAPLLGEAAASWLCSSDHRLQHK